jgi:hypothetical protein
VEWRLEGGERVVVAGWIMIQTMYGIDGTTSVADWNLG